jgi:hypothetical protein
MPAKNKEDMIVLENLNVPGCNSRVNATRYYAARKGTKPLCWYHVNG